MRTRLKENIKTEVFKFDLISEEERGKQTRSSPQTSLQIQTVGGISEKKLHEHSACGIIITYRLCVSSVCEMAFITPSSLSERERERLKVEVGHMEEM